MIGLLPSFCLLPSVKRNAPKLKLRGTVCRMVGRLLLNILNSDHFYVFPLLSVAEQIFRYKRKDSDYFDSCSAQQSENYVVAYMKVVYGYTVHYDYEENGEHIPAHETEDHRSIVFPLTSVLFLVFKDGFQHTVLQPFFLVLYFTRCQPRSFLLFCLRAFRFFFRQQLKIPFKDIVITLPFHRSRFLPALNRRVRSDRRGFRCSPLPCSRQPTEFPHDV